MSLLYTTGISPGHRSGYTVGAARDDDGGARGYRRLVAASSGDGLANAGVCAAKRQLTARTCGCVSTVDYNHPAMLQLDDAAYLSEIAKGLEAGQPLRCRAWQGSRCPKAVLSPLPRFVTDCESWMTSAKETPQYVSQPPVALHLPSIDPLPFTALHFYSHPYTSRCI